MRFSYLIKRSLGYLLLLLVLVLLLLLSLNGLESVRNHGICFVDFKNLNPGFVMQDMGI